MKNQMKSVILLVTASLFSLSIYAQPVKQQDRKEIRMEKVSKMRSMKWAYITSELKLNDNEMSRLKPIFERHEQNKADKMIKMRANRNQKSKAPLTDEEAEARLNQKMQFQKEQMDNKNVYINELKSVLTPSQTLKFLEIEQEWSKNVMQKTKQRMNKRNKR